MFINNYFLFSGLSVLLTFCSTAQVPKVEKSVYSVQTGFLGVWVNNEYRLSDRIALRSEVGFDLGLHGPDQITAEWFPVIKLEPKYYYNLAKRVAKGKNISKNSGNFVALKLSYHPNWFAIHQQGEPLFNYYDITPKWGIRRNYFKHLNFELGGGIGLLFVSGPNVSAYYSKTNYNIDFHLRIGYTF